MKTEGEVLDFGSFEPNVVPAHEPVSREAFRGMSPTDAACELARVHAQRVSIEPVTMRQKAMVAKQVLDALAKKGHDLASVDARTMAAYREWLRVRVERGEISESYAGHIAIQWNATVRAVLGEEQSRDLRIKGFTQHARKIVRRDEDEMQALIGAANRIGYRTEEDREAFLCYLELAWSTAGRAGSLLSETLTFACVDWTKGMLRFRHVKNKDEHEAVLSERAVAKLRERRAYCVRQPWWRGDETPILAARTGKPLATKSVNRMLARAGVEAGFEARLTTHGIRKSAGTIMARRNARYAREQLGITAKVFEANYNQPTVEDRLTRRDLVPSVGTALDPDAMVGQALLELEAGRLTRAEFAEIKGRAERMRIVPGMRAPENTGYL